MRMRKLNERPRTLGCGSEKNEVHFILLLDAFGAFPAETAPKTFY